MEFGNALQVSKHFLDADPNNIESVKRELQYGFDRAKKQYFPDWDGQYELKNYGIREDDVIVRVDGEEVPEDILFQYTDWSLDEDAGEWPFGDEYSTKTYFYYQIGWYAAVPNEFIKMPDKE